MVPLPQRNKREKEYATAKPNKFRKIDSYFKNMSSIELNRQKSLEDSFLNLAIDDHERNINSQDVRAVTGQDFLEWLDNGLSWSKSKELIHSTPVNPQFNSGSKKQESLVIARVAQCQTSNYTPRKNLQTIKDLEKDLDDAISRTGQEATQQNVNIFDVDIHSIFNPN